MNRRNFLASLVGSVFARALPPIKPKPKAEDVGISIRMIQTYDRENDRVIARMDVMGYHWYRDEYISTVVIG